MNCPDCNEAGRKVKRITLKNLVRPEHQSAIGDGQYHVCLTPDCETVYFSGDSGFRKSDLVVRFGLKETQSPRPVCYCFDHTIEEIHDEITRAGKSTVVDSIKADMKGPGCRCEQTNPLGACCLKSVSEIAQDGFRIAGKSAMVADVPDVCCVEDCCTRPSPVRSGTFAVGGSVVAAALSSACCWLPLVLLALGASAAGVAGFFEQWRLPFIVAAVVLLGTGFCFQYGRKPKCDDGSCVVPSRRVRILNQSMLWMATTFVAAMVFFPKYVQHLVGGSDAVTIADSSLEGTRLVVPVEGMTCEGCASNLTNSLSKVAGVSGIEVSYADKQAVVLVPSTDDGIRQRIVDAVKAAGYSAKKAGERDSP